MLDEEKIMARANELYAAEKVRKYGPSYADVKMGTDTAKCLLKAIVEALNARVQF